jgi:hypothetical protein
VIYALSDIQTGASVSPASPRTSGGPPTSLSTHASGKSTCCLACRLYGASAAPFQPPDSEAVEKGIKDVEAHRCPIQSEAEACGPRRILHGGLCHNSHERQQCDSIAFCRSTRSCSRASRQAVLTASEGRCVASAAIMPSTPGAQIDTPARVRTKRSQRCINESAWTG